MTLTLAWIRREMRLHDNAVLHAALASPHPVQLVFVFDTDILANFANPNDRRVQFLARTLCHMHNQLAAKGGGMLVLAGRAQEVMPTLTHALGASQLVCAEDFEPATRSRDAAVHAALAGTSFTQVLDHVMLSPARVLKDNGTPFKVFTPYYKKWLSMLTPTSAAEYVVHDAGRYASLAVQQQKAKHAGLQVLDCAMGEAAMLEAIGYNDAEDALWRVDDVAQRLSDFVDDKLRPYPAARNFLAESGTSKLSPYLRFGLVSVRECVRAAEAKGGGEKWINELCWREFYMAILYHFPFVTDLEFMVQYQNKLHWNRDEAQFAAFCEGRTGYPVVDAAVRELLSTGWMHNRARMIVASFLTKDLFIDWRWGETFFAKHLMDYELSSNCGGWQWASSTGTDAAPYFRIFNPVLQSEKFDADGVYIKTYVPELRGMDARDIHAPWESLLKPAGYPLPIVDHKTAKDHAVNVFRALGHKMGGEA